MPEAVDIKVRLISRPQIDAEAVLDYLESVGGEKWYERVFEGTDNGDIPSMASAEALVEFGGRLCYKSWAVGLNPNVTKVREDSAAYLRNILDSGHGSVLQHANFGFVVENGTRVYTHEQVRHVAGTAFSQESQRYVRLDNIPFWFPKWALDDTELMDHAWTLLEYMEDHQRWMAEHFKLDSEGVPFSEKKAKTSFMRRFAPQGVSTHIMVTANVRAIRHMLEMRTDGAAEEEIRLIFGQIGDLMIDECPLLFGDYTKSVDGVFDTDFRKV
jgi:thymidylate synthase (FAD)